VIDEAEVSSRPRPSRLGRVTLTALMMLAFLAVLLLSSDLCPIDGLPCSVQAWPIFFDGPKLLY
jgi:hypothetical protein